METNQQNVLKKAICQTSRRYEEQEQESHITNMKNKNKKAI